jgi:hypothetical protein
MAHRMNKFFQCLGNKSGSVGSSHCIAPPAIPRRATPAPASKMDVKRQPSNVKRRWSCASAIDCINHMSLEEKEKKLALAYYYDI